MLSLRREARDLTLKSIIDFTSVAYVVAHKEDTRRLEASLASEGFSVAVVRGPYSPEQETWSSNMKCFANHANVWRQIAASESEWAVVVEADFVPVYNFAGRIAPLPFAEGQEVGFGWLYSAGSILYGFCRYGFPHGHGNATVAYLIKRTVAIALLDFFSREVAKNPRGHYIPWETYLGVYLRRERGILNYFPVRQLGEHGGVPQKEHAVHGVRAWHQADVLAGPLVFLPDYARGSELRFLIVRFRAAVRAWARLILLRFFDPRYVNSDTTKSRWYMALFSVSRLLLKERK